MKVKLIQFDCLIFIFNQVAELFIEFGFNFQV